MNSPHYALSIVSILLLLAISYKAFSWRKAVIRCRRARNQFRLFAVRDNLILLVANQHLNEQDWIFQNYYKSVNRIVHKQHEFTLLALAHAMRNESATWAAEKFIERLLVELKRCNPEVQSMVEAYYRAIIEIVIENSFLVRAAFKYRQVMSPIVKTWRKFLSFLATYLWLRPIAEPRIMVFEAYDSSNQALSSVTAY